MKKQKTSPYPIRLRTIPESRPPLQIEVHGAIIELGEPVAFLTVMDLEKINAKVEEARKGNSHG